MRSSELKACSGEHTCNTNAGSEACSLTRARKREREREREKKKKNKSEREGGSVRERERGVSLLQSSSFPVSYSCGFPIEGGKTDARRARLKKHT